MLGDDDPNTRIETLRVRLDVAGKQIGVVAEDLASGKHDRIVTRFPPEPNGYMHIGHAKAILLNYWIAAENDGQFNLRFDDTNPIKEEEEYVDAIKADIAWLGYDWGRPALLRVGLLRSALQWAAQLTRKAGKAYVDDQSAGRFREPRDADRAGDRQPLSGPLRRREPRPLRAHARRRVRGRLARAAREDRHGSGNLNMRDPVLYRILRATHHRTGDNWCIYPMYDFAHGQSDSIEGDHALAVLARVRRPPAAVRLVPRKPRDPRTLARSSSLD